MPKCLHWLIVSGGQTGCRRGGGCLYLSCSPRVSRTWARRRLSHVYAQGTWKTEYSRLYFSGYVRDTSCDGRNVEIEARLYTVYAGF